jgi:hypothetical protein
LSAESRARRTDIKSHPPRAGRPPAPATILVLGGVIAVVVAVVLVLSSGGGGKSTVQGLTAGQGAGKSTASTKSSHDKQTSSHHSEGPVAAASPAATSVAVLNGTSTNGLAHSLSKDLQQSGYSRATALNGTPPGPHATTVVEYTSGNRADAQGVARALGVTQVQPMESAVSSLAAATTVVVIAGEDKAATLGETSEGSGASSATGQ